MIDDKRMKYIKSKDGMDYYIFTPSIFRQYFNKCEDWTDHRGSFTHGLHMFFYYIRGYRILYMMNGDDIVAYLVFARCGRTVIKGSNRKDIFTVYITTHPDYRNKGYASDIVREMLHGIGLKYRRSFKTIRDSNIGSQKAAFANGYEVLYPIKKSAFLRTISRSDNSEWKLYFCQ